MRVERDVEVGRLKGWKRASGGRTHMALGSKSSGPNRAGNGTPTKSVRRSHPGTAHSAKIVKSVMHGIEACS